MAYYGIQSGNADQVSTRKSNEQLCNWIFGVNYFYPSVEKMVMLL